MKFKFKKGSLIFSILFLVFSCTAFFLLYREINSNNIESEKMFLDWQTETVRRNEISALDRSMKNIQTEKSSIETHFAKSSDIVPFLDTIEGLAPKVGAKTEITSVDVEKEGKSLLVGLKATGSFISVYKFLMLLENSQYELEFTSVNLQKSTATNLKDQNWEMILKIKLLSFMQ
ncbi:MAG: hypothetical protein WC662_00990 [Candidatus Paceibacterota bacterium]|jgi:hypothetical protein